MASLSLAGVLEYRQRTRRRVGQWFRSPVTAPAVVIPDALWLRHPYTSRCGAGRVFVPQAAGSS
jgi:hypothetical protein